MTARSDAFDAAFGDLRSQAPDALLSLIKKFKDDPRQSKIDLGVGVYRDAHGRTPVLKSVKAAEEILITTQSTKAYLGPEGDVEFLDLLKPIIFSDRPVCAEVFGAQTPGGTGALRLAAELISAGQSGARIWLGTPSWPNHAPIFGASGLEVVNYRWYDPGTGELCFDEGMESLRGAQAGDVVLLHGCCHNPTGADPDTAQWRSLCSLIEDRGLIPLVDLAYQGLGRGLAPDAGGLELVLEAAETVLVAYSCDKNFGLYRERTGALFVRARSHADLLRSNILQLARCAWSMPPDHGAAVVRTILNDAKLCAMWRNELDDMRKRLFQVRREVAGAIPALQGLETQYGLFALLPFSPVQIKSLQQDHGVYMADSGRINLAGLSRSNISEFARAIVSVTERIRAMNC